jgi:hypothetical protein
MNDKIQVYTARGTPANGITAPATSTNNGLAAFDGTTGLALKDTGVLYTDVVTLTGTQTLTNKTLTQPTIASFFNAQHGHQSAGDGATLLPGALSIPYVLIVDQKTKNTHAGASTSTTWHTRTLNTEVQDTNSKATLASNQVTLAAGTWDIRVSAPAYASSVHAIVLRNDTSGTVLLFGWNEDASSTDTSVTRAWASGRLTLAASQALSIRHYISVGVASFGLGVALNVNDPDAASRSEVYATFEAWQVG